ncbi:uncharacterized protein L969DRAFT_47134 [Mixia osmundae IAM 14324]|nr:uncharacterized protein L969DRAFT_47134 [Mixia osmundae IAM 14324]KEI40235.1 hypothetical protein L969DRAFT_47134 [Mixia osmundae IAM 14324]
MITANGGDPTEKWQQKQLSYANVSRQSSSPHHHARAANLQQRGLSSSAVAIHDPSRLNRPASAASTTGPAPSTTSGGFAADEGVREKDSSKAPINAVSAIVGKEAGAPAQTWTTLDLGGMALKNMSDGIFRYTFLTTLYISHNALTVLPSSISQLNSLTLLDVSSNKLSSLPPELGLLTRLKELLAFDNHLSSLPPELGTLYQLDLIGLEGNPLNETHRSLLDEKGTKSLIDYLRDSCPIALPPPDRDWITLDTQDLGSLENEDAPAPESFSLLCYNILYDKYATAHMYGYTPSWALAWDYRKDLILQEAMSYESEILCLQEVDQEQFEDFFLHHLSQQDYEGVFFPKSRARTMSSDEKRHVDGCATFYKSTTFSLVEQQLIEFNQIAMRRPDFKKTEDMFNRVMTKDNIAVVTLLEHRQSGARLIVANAHIYWDPEFKDVKLVQVAMLMEELEKIGQSFSKLPPKRDLGEGYTTAPSYSDGTKIPTIVCGDFNSEPSSGVYHFLANGAVGRDHPDFKSHIYGNYTSDGLAHRFNLRSAYSHGDELLPFTNYTPGFKGVIDYIWYTASTLSVTGLLGPVDSKYLEKVVGFPSSAFASDHLSLLSEFKIKPVVAPVRKSIARW